MTRWLALLLTFMLLLACGNKAGPAATQKNITTTQATSAVDTPASETDPIQETNLETMQSELGLKVLTALWSGDLDGMIERRVVRVLTVYGLGRYFLDGPEEKGLVYELFKEYENSLNKQKKTGHLRVHVVFIPVARDELLPGLISGRGDIAAAGLTITPEREEIIDFSNPMSKTINEVLVTGPSAPAVASLDDLAGQVIYVRFSSSYYASLLALNQKFQDAGRPAMDILEIPELLEDEDLLEMVNAGLLPWVVVDDYKGEIWSKVFTELAVRNDLILRSGGHIGFAFRKNSPELAASLNEFLQTHKEGTMLGNVLINRNFRNFNWVSNALQRDDLRRFEHVAGIFRKYGEQYGFDYLLVAAQGYQESRLEQSLRSPAGAIGVMQLLPTTAADPNVDIPDIWDEEANIHAGIKYLNFIRTRYFSDPEIDRLNQTLMVFASYNAGPARIQGLRKQAKSQGLNPNLWFNNVEVVAAREIGRETVQYVANIYKYYISYRMSAVQELSRAAAREQQGLGTENTEKQQKEIYND